MSNQEMIQYVRLMLMRDCNAAKIRAANTKNETLRAAYLEDSLHIEEARLAFECALIPCDKSAEDV